MEVYAKICRRIGESGAGKEVVARFIHSPSDRADKRFVAKAALYARREAGMRSVSHLVAGEIAWITRRWSRVTQRALHGYWRLLAFLKWADYQKLLARKLGAVAGASRGVESVTG